MRKVRGKKHFTNSVYGWKMRVEDPLLYKIQKKGLVVDDIDDGSK